LDARVSKISPAQASRWSAKGVEPRRDRNAGIDIRSRRPRRPQEEGDDEALEAASDLQRRSFMFRYRN